VPWPRARFELSTPKGPRTIYLTAARTVDRTQVPAALPAAAPGTVCQADKHGWTVACGDGSLLQFISLVPEGRREMSAEAFISGSSFVEPGTVLHGCGADQL